LVIVPKTLLENWQREIQHFSGGTLSCYTAEEDEVAIKNGNLKKPLHNITAAGFIHNRLDNMLLQHMKKENKTEYPYNYWLNKGTQSRGHLKV
jgi:hypothetical protein